MYEDERARMREVFKNWRNSTGEKYEQKVSMPELYDKLGNEFFGELCKEINHLGIEKQELQSEVWKLEDKKRMYEKYQEPYLKLMKDILELCEGYSEKSVECASYIVWKAVGNGDEWPLKK